MPSESDPHSESSHGHSKSLSGSFWGSQLGPVEVGITVDVQEEVIIKNLEVGTVADVQRVVIIENLEVETDSLEVADESSCAF